MSTHQNLNQRRKSIQQNKVKHVKHESPAESETNAEKQQNI